MKNLVLYVHGQGGSPLESCHYEPLFPEYEVRGLDYRGCTPWETELEFRQAVTELSAAYESIVLIANSIGAYFCMNAGIDMLIDRAYFISPIVDLERLILDQMGWAKVSEDQLKAERVIANAFGEDLSWDYLCYVREHPVKWELPTKILYGSRDNLTEYETISAFAKDHQTGLTVMENGEHWFHTDDQMRFLDDWIRECEADHTGGIILRTDRLRLYPASKKQMETVIAAESDAELGAAYSEMLDGCLRHPDQWEWYALWMIERKDGTQVGDLCFKGLQKNGIVEVGYGILEEYREQGYATEAVRAACRWAFQHAEVKSLEAETDAGDTASQRVLEKCGFRPNGTIGEEGPRFSLAKP